MTMIELYISALDEADRVVSALGDDDLDRPSECAGWTIRQLLEHMTGQNHGFAAAIDTGDADKELYEPAPAAEWSASVAELRAALREPAQSIRLVELNPDGRFDLDTVLRIHTLDQVVHTRDVAGRGYRPAEDLVAAVAETAQIVPADGRGERGTFAPVVEAGPADEDDAWANALRHLGRQP